jgi:hypothetical protein
MSLRTQRDAEIEKLPEYKRELEHALAFTSYRPVITDIREWLKRLAKEARGK